MNFGQAVEALKSGKNVKRKGWGGYWFFAKGPVLQDHLEDGYVSTFSFNNGLIVAVLKDMGGCAPAQAYQADILAEDWEVVGSETETIDRWKAAIENARFMLEEYKKIPTGMFGAINIANAISRYDNGERTPELLDELESIE